MAKIPSRGTSEILTKRWRCDGSQQHVNRRKLLTNIGLRYSRRLTLGSVRHVLSWHPAVFYKGCEERI